MILSSQRIQLIFMIFLNRGVTNLIYFYQSKNGAIPKYSIPQRDILKSKLKSAITVKPKTFSDRVSFPHRSSIKMGTSELALPPCSPLPKPEHAFRASMSQIS
jgi:hypothetical protein